MKKAKKSYNKLPSFAARFIGYFAAFSSGIAAALLLAPSELVDFVLTEIRGCLWGIAGEWTGLVAILMSAAVALALSAAKAASDLSRFHNGVWMGEPPSTNASRGSARLESRPSVLRKEFYSWRRGARPLPGVVVGGVGSDRRELLVDTGKHHTLLLGGTGSGKTTSVLIPTQVCLSRSGVSSVTLDPKGEIFAVCGREAMESGAKVVMVDFAEPRKSDGWLPLQPAIDCANGARGRRKEELPGELRILASTLIPERHESSPMWTQAARILFCGLCGFVVESDLVPEDCRNLSTVAALAAMPQEVLQEVVGKMPEDSPSRLQLASVTYAPAETFGGFAINLNTALSAYADPSVSPMLARSDFAAEEFLEGQVALFVRYNSSTEAFNPLIAAFVEQLVDSLRRLAENRCDGTLPTPVYLLLEELPQLPRVSLGKTLAICRSQGILATCCVQSRGMLEAVYREDAPGMFDNMSTTVFLQGSDLETNKHYSELLGGYTVESTTGSKTQGARGGSSTESASYSESRLFRVEELAQWGYDVGHLVIKGGRAFACSSLPVSRTFVGDELGLDGVEPGAAKRAEMSIVREVKNPDSAKAWTWGDRDREAALAGIAGSIAENVDPRYW